MTHIKDLRISRNLTQMQVSQMLGITRGAYANIENEKREPDIATLILLADYYGVTVDYLIGHEKEPTVKDDGLTEVERNFMALSPQRQEELLRYMEFLASQESAQ